MPSATDRIGDDHRGSTSHRRNVTRRRDEARLFSVVEVAEASRLELVVRLGELVASVHHEWPVCGDWFVDRHAGHDERASTGGGGDLDIVVSGSAVVENRNVS